MGQGVDLLVDHESYLLSIHTKFLEDEISDVFAYLDVYKRQQLHILKI